MNITYKHFVSIKINDKCTNFFSSKLLLVSLMEQYKISSQYLQYVLNILNAN